MVLQNTGKYRADREDSNKKDAGPSSGPRSVQFAITHTVFRSTFIVVSKLNYLIICMFQGGIFRVSDSYGFGER